MSIVEENMRRVQTKLQQLLKQHLHLQKENEQLKSMVGTLRGVAVQDQQRISQLEEQAGILKSAAGKMEEPDKKLFEKHINQYIKEIDKCIGLLSE
jgi:hypothetical protein